MQDLEIEQYIEVWLDRERRESRRAAGVIAALGNCIYQAAGIRAKLKPEHFYSESKKSNKQNSDELINAAILAFGPPPKQVTDRIKARQKQKTTKSTITHGKRRRTHS